jgi:hypothetical protein
MSAGPNLTPVSPERHGTRRWRRFSSYAFVQAHPVVPIVLGEHEQVAACLPLLFANIAIGAWPVALTRMGAQTALVAQNGAWRGAYVPSILRVHPFHAQPTENAQFVLTVDEASGLVTDDPNDLPFFTPEGELTPELRQLVDFFRNRVQAEAQTRAAMAAITRAGVLKPFCPPDGMALPVAGLLHIDAEAFRRLGRVALAELHRVDALGLVHAALVGGHHLAFLAQAEALMSQTGPLDKAAGRPADRELSGFFDALASAQEHEPTLADWISPTTLKPN